ncbi:hypothetical protein BMYO_0394 [Bifidobacterium myosotis]|uniref:Uncharacterized protein n=1 Tax=Bifidobacterium myosotis TaxID=1630166 RepID=A0A261FQ29_9BIFI|nr:hypothetical protein BMYO_0394 [Bifidobacterium myosotis]
MPSRLCPHPYCLGTASVGVHTTPVPPQYGTQTASRPRLIRHLHRRLVAAYSPYRRHQASDRPLYDAEPLSGVAKQPSIGSPTPLTHSASLPYQPLASQHRKQPTKSRQTATHWLPDTTDTLSVVTIPTTGRPTPKTAHQASPNSHPLAPQRRSAAQHHHEASPWPNHPAHRHASEAIPPQHGLTTTHRITRPKTRSPEPTSTGTKNLQ